MDTTRYYEASYIKANVPERSPGSIVRRTDFKYMQGHGTFYKFVEEYFPHDLLKAKKKDRVSLVLYNCNTDQLDEVVFELRSQTHVGDSFIWLQGRIADIEDYFAIKINYSLDDPLDSTILVFASAPPYYGCIALL